jgi:NAD(P)-dependent dehydrogenase (short-subunit alcohol dehydrogenase family)/acyl carrier protein
MSYRPASHNEVAAVVQREINTFVLESFGRILKPKIVEVVRRELDPHFTGESLDRILQDSSALRQDETSGGIKPSLPSFRVQPPAENKRPAPFPGRDTDTAVLPPEPATQKDKEQGVDYVEQVIRIIMKATGYERDEIEPDMDIRQDLSIRSSRLPVIVVEIEKRFGITVNVEDFVGLRTVRDIGNCIEKLASNNGQVFTETRAAGSVEDMPPGADLSIGITGVPGGERVLAKSSIKRLILEETPFPRRTLTPLTLEPAQGVAVISNDPRSPLSTDLCRILGRRFGATPLNLDCLGRGGGILDLRTPEGAKLAAQRLDGARSLAGLVLVMDGDSRTVLSGMKDVPAFLGGFFSCFKSLMRSKRKAFCLLVQRGFRPHTPEGVAGEGVLGMFLAASHEYPSMLFRSLVLDVRTEIEGALNTALDTGNPVIQCIFHEQEAFSVKAANHPLSLMDKLELKLDTEDVVVISGGAKGVAWHIARALAPYRPRVVLLGRTELDTFEAYAALRETRVQDNSVSHPLFRRKGAALKEAASESEVAKGRSGLEIARNVSRLSALGLKVSYQCCDVADTRAVDKTLDQVAKQFGRIDGIIHGAGLIRDAFTEFMTPEDFRKVMDVKFLGAWNLYCASRDRGLRFFAALSSLAAVQGNVGQVNYCAANRSLSALLQSWSISHEEMLSKVFMLPPIEGTGMAEAPEVKELMKLKGLEPAFVHADEFAQMLWRELFLGPRRQSCVLPVRTFPSVKGTLVEPEPDGDEASRYCGGLRFEQRDLPMIGSVERLDLRYGELVARRTFSRDVDLWIEDHKPFAFLKNPPVSGIMAAETLLEAAHLLYPYLQVLGVRRLRFENILECPSGAGREVLITCLRGNEVGREVCCEVEISGADISPSGRQLDTWGTYYRGQVILGPHAAPLSALPGFPVQAEDLDTRSLQAHEICNIYEDRTGLRGRYRVLNEICGTGPGVLKGVMVYREQEDIAGLGRVQYLYSPYLLEALMHLFAFYPVLRQEEVHATMIPAGMEEMRFTRPARDCERFVLEARLRSRDEQGFTWDGRALDETDTAILQVYSLRMNRFDP